MVLLIPPPSEQATAKAYLHPSSGLSEGLTSELGKCYLCTKESVTEKELGFTSFVCS